MPQHHIAQHARRPDVSTPEPLSGRHAGDDDAVCLESVTAMNTSMNTSSMNESMDESMSGSAAAPAQFFPPTDDDAVTMLLQEHRAIKAEIHEVAEFMSNADAQCAAGYFYKAHYARYSRYISNVDTIFDAEAATRYLDASFWKRALDLTDLMACMPDKRRTQWFEQIQNADCPPFTENVVRDNLRRLLAQRMDFLAEMIDGLFTGLSGEHVTNRPEGFTKRMIIDYVYSEAGSPGSKEGLIHDLRAVVAKFMGRDPPGYGASRSTLRVLRSHTGVWHDMDGGALRIRVYKRGTAHLQVHPDIAWRLNQVLAHLHPKAIPPALRRPPARRMKSVRLFDRPIPFAILEVLVQQRVCSTIDGYRLSLPHSADDKHVRRAAERVLEALGGVKQADRSYLYDYDPRTALETIIVSGMLPDQQAYQFYPTPRAIAAEVAARAAIAPGHRCLEPSAGQGALAEMMPAAQTLCVEASRLHCNILESRHFAVVNADFLGWREGHFDRICMNPPYSSGRARAHLEHAATMLAPGGRLVCVLPSGYAHNDLLPDFKTQWSPAFDNAFCGTSISVALLTADRR